MRKRVIHPVWIWLRYLITVGCGLTILVTVSDAPAGNPFHEPYHNGAPASGALACGVAIAVLCTYWIFVFCWWCVQTFLSPVIEQALQPIPSPQEIELELRRNGHDPSLQDIAAVHQMATAQRNEAVGALGIIAAMHYFGRRR